MVNENGATLYSFCQSVRGASHVERGTPCEDASGAYSAEGGAYHVIAVADGHGDVRCLRSQRGAELAVSVAMDFLKEVAEEKLSASEAVRERFFHDMFTNPRYRQLEFRRWSDVILSRWNDALRRDYDANPPAPDALASLPERLRQPDAVPHMYGSTLMAALYFPPALMLLQQGDGRCEVFYADGAINQPIPWDTRCEGNVTTSLCDPDATISFRSQILDLRETPVAACYLGTDGVEDAYRDTYTDLGESHTLMGGVHCFYKALSCEAAERSPEALTAYLSETLPDFSARGQYGYGGSWDDVSIAGIVRPETLSRFAETWRRDVRRYGLEEGLFWKADALRSGARKYEILSKRCEEARNRLDAVRDEYSVYHEELAHLRVNMTTLEKTRGNHEEELAELREEIRQRERLQSACEGSLQIRSRELRDAEKAFADYDAEYQAIKEDKRRILEELLTLSQAQAASGDTPTQAASDDSRTQAAPSGAQTQVASADTQAQKMLLSQAQKTLLQAQKALSQAQEKLVQAQAAPGSVQTPAPTGNTQAQAPPGSVQTPVSSGDTQAQAAPGDTPTQENLSET